MRKWLIIITFILMAQIVYGLTECERVITSNDVPCMIISSWEYDNCNTTQTRIYNETPSLMATRNYTDFGQSGRCNFTWNISTVGSYFYNNTNNGDSGTIIVEVDDKLNLAIVIGLSIFSAIFIGIGIILWYSKKEIQTEQE